MASFLTYDELQRQVLAIIVRDNINTPTTETLDMIEQSSKDFMRLKNLFYIFQGFFNKSYDEHFLELGKTQF